MRVRIELFGRVAESAGVRELALELGERADVADAAAALVARYPQLAWIREGTRPARNREYCRWSDPLADGDEVSFIPPVSGG